MADAYGTTVDELLGKTDADFNPNPDEVENFRRDDLEVMDTLQDKIIPEEVITDSKGNVRYLQTVKRAIIGEDNRADQLLGVSTDISERKRIEKKLQEAHNELEIRVQERTADLDRANKAKNEFLANMSHELRPPLHGILSFSNFGIKKCETVERKKLLAFFMQIRESGKILLNLLNDLLDLAKLESGKMVFNFKPTNLGRLIDKVVDEFSSLVSERNVNIQYHQSYLDTQVTLDPEKIMQVVRNLLSNALKYSPEHGIIEITSSQNNHVITLSVRDQGVGVPEDEVETVFDHFIQSSKTKTGAGGTGLGLSICREIIAAHQGHIWAVNGETGGAIFSFEIPTNLEPVSLTDSGVSNSDPLK